MSPIELAEACLRRIDAVEPELNAFITVTGDLARASAREAEREIIAGRYRGALHGIPIAVKDLFATVGIRTTAGSRILRDCGRGASRQARHARVRVWDQLGEPALR
ncbi:MAG: hypothetical protein E6I64_05680 [Chloroflexi bacterium]|nr:MAG: hypothetical protein E6I64_05680 [Chloroflexota bacterium]